MPAKTMKAMVLVAKEKLELQERPVPEPDEGEVLVRVRAVGVCGSDVHWFQHMHMGNRRVEAPLVLGHEFSGEVVQLGRGVSGIREWSRVAVEPGVPCGHCRVCRQGRYNLCESVRFCGTPPADGAYCEYYASPATFVHAVPESMSFPAAAMAEPMSCAVHAVRLSGLAAGDSVAILGAGPIGLSILQAARAVGATRIVVTDLLPERLAKATALGTDAAIHVAGADRAEVVRRVKAALPDGGADVVFEAAGVPETYDQAVHIAAPGATYCQVGIASEPVALDWHTARWKELTIKVSLRMCHDFPRTISLAQAGKVDLEALVTHRFPLEKLPEAFKLVASYGDGVIRAVIEP